MFSLSDSDLSREQKACADSVLQSGETLLWAGRPVCRLLLMMLLNSLLVLGMAAYFGLRFVREGMHEMMVQADTPTEALLYLPFLGIPLGMLAFSVGYPLWYWYRTANTFYLITDRRYLAVCKYPWVGFRQQEWTGEPLDIETYEDGTGDIVLEYRESRHKGRVSLNPVGLLGIPDFEQVKPLIGACGEAPAEEVEEAEAAAVPAAGPGKGSVIFLALAAAAWSYALYSAADTYQTLSSWAKAEGVVTSLESRKSSGRHGTHSVYRACYRFEVDGVCYEGKESVSSNPPSHRRGEKLTVVYNPADPRESDADSVFHLYFKSVGFGAVGVILFLIACCRFNLLKGLAFWRSRA